MKKNILSRGSAGIQRGVCEGMQVKSKGECVDTCEALTGPLPSSFRLRSCHLHLSYTERALDSRTHSHRHAVAAHRCARSLALTG